MKVFKIALLMLLITGSLVAKEYSYKCPKKPVLSIDFQKPDYKASETCIVRAGLGTEFNPECGRSWKLDRYDAEKNEFSTLEIEFSMHKKKWRDYSLEILGCSRKDPPLDSHVTITVNDKVVAKGYHMYNGPDSFHFLDEKGRPGHLRWDVFEITKELQEGKNTLRISLDKETQSGISISSLHIRPSQKKDKVE